jgi:hypothetical protein
MFEDRFETLERYADSGDHVTAVTAGVGAFGPCRQSPMAWMNGADNYFVPSRTPPSSKASTPQTRHPVSVAPTDEPRSWRMIVGWP